ncbi:MAG: ATP-grasp domain-containing protein [Verrucomicrobiota bacterium]
MDLLLLENVLWVAVQPTEFPGYDFRFSDFFECRRPSNRPERVRAVARMGATGDYAGRRRELLSNGIELIHMPEEHLRCSQLPQWYPLLADMTPRSVWFDAWPDAETIARQFGWPVFVKGERQTSRHQRKLSILENPADFERVKTAWDADPILRWQRVVFREFMPLRLVGQQLAETLPRAFEFRSFWWKGQFVGVGRYWTDEHYQLSDSEMAEAIALGAEAARRVGVTFLAVDMAQTREGRWVVIECNDGQDSGYRAVAPVIMWRHVLDLERGERIA